MPRGITNFDPIDPSEDDVFFFDFTDRNFVSGETISSVVWDIGVRSPPNGDPTPAQRILSTPAISGFISTAMVGTMLNGVQYEISAEATTSRGRKIKETGIVLCTQLK